MQTRRLASVTVSAVAALVLSIGVALSRPQVVGVASPSPVSPVPAAGDCVFAGESGPWGRWDEQGTFRENPFARRFGPCTGQWFGEVSAVRTGAAMVKNLTSDEGLAAADAICSAAAADYLGAPNLTTPRTRWQATALPTGSPVGPDPRQAASGQSWQACILTPPLWDADGQMAGAQTADGFAGLPRASDERLHDRWADPVLRNRYGQCQDSAVGTGQAVFCGSPHDAEWLGLGWWSTPAPTADELRQSCTDLASRLMQRPDPTAGGVLTVETSLIGVADSPEIVGPDTNVPPSTSGQCRVLVADPASVLTSTVLGVGGGAVRLTPR